MRFSSLLLVLLIVSSARAQANPVETRQAIVRRHHTAGPWIVFGLGFPVILGGVLAEILSQPITGNSCATCPPDPLNDSQRAGQIAGWVGVGTGVAMIIGGLVWHFAEPTGPQVITVGPIVSHGGSGLMIRATF